MSKIKGAIVVDTGRCKGCALCVVACPQHVIALAEKKVKCAWLSLCGSGCAGCMRGLHFVRHRMP